MKELRMLIFLLVCLNIVATFLFFYLGYKFAEFTEKEDKNKGEIK